MSGKKMHTAGIVLCGGESRRMGAPKAWLPLGEETFLQRTVRLLQSCVDSVIVAAAPGQSLPPLAQEVRIAHDPEPFRGPLQGIVTGLRLAARADADVAFVVATDLPYLTTAFVRFLLSRLGESDVVVPVLEGRYHPLCAVYRVAPTLVEGEKLLRAGETRPRRLYDRLRVCVLDEREFEKAGFAGTVLANVNTPDEYATLIEDFLRSRRESPGDEHGS